MLIHWWFVVFFRGSFRDINMTDRITQAKARLGIPAHHKTILSLDGGGIRGIMTLQLLKRLEEEAGAPCYEIFDMAVGTSTGGIIAAFIVMGKSALEIEKLYVELVNEVFTGRALGHQIINPPAYTKRKYVEILKGLMGELTLRQASERTKTDLMITSKDVVAGEETFFSVFHSTPENSCTYENVLLRAVVEATMSAPTYFHPMDRFIDGGATAYNNPVLAALIEAIQYGPKGDRRKPYEIGELTLMSFGTGCRPQYVEVENVQHPGLFPVGFWLKWLMTEAGDDASDMQVNLLRSRRLFAGLDFRRFQISLDSPAVRKLPNLELPEGGPVSCGTLHQLSDQQLSAIALDEVAWFGVMRTLGMAMVKYLEDDAQVRGRPLFGYDLVTERGKESLVTSWGEIDTIRKNLSSSAWVDDPERKV